MVDPLPSDIFQTGQVLNNTYRIQGILGRGGTGEVYRAENSVTGRVFALKALSAQFSGNADYIELMKREEEISEISDDAVVRYVDCWKTDSDHVVLVMEYVDGPSLADVMTQRRLEPRELLIVAHRLAGGLKAAHRHGIVHRDLSPDNVILRNGEPERATIIDFGIAKDTAAGARTIVGDNFAGKYEYAAPEQMHGIVDGRSDLYALGATVLAALKGETPYLGTTPGEIVRRKASRLDTEGVPEPLKSVIDAFSAPEPDDRPVDAAAAAALIEELWPPAAGKGAPPPITKTQKRKRGGKRGGPGLLTVGGVLLLAAAAAAGAFVYLREPPPPLVTPYTLSAIKPGDGGASMTGFAPDQTAVDNLTAAFASAAEARPELADIEIAAGVPDARWPEDVAGLIGRLTSLENWTLSVSGRAARIGGVAPNQGTMEDIRERLTDFGAAQNLDLSLDLLAGPANLSADELRAALVTTASCGPLELGGGEVFAMGAEIIVSGAVESDEALAEAERRLESLIGSRTLRNEILVLNPSLCRVRSILPPQDGSAMTMRLSQGTDGRLNPSGVFVTGENPVLDILLPATETGHLSAIVVDNTGAVYTVLPNAGNLETDVQQLGEIEGTTRRVRILYSVAEATADPTLPGVTVDPDNFGKSEVVVIWSDLPFLSERRPLDESVESISDEIQRQLASGSDRIKGIATSVIEAQKP